MYLICVFNCRIVTPSFFSCSFVHTFTSIRLMYHTFIILDGRLCHQLLVCGYIVSLAVFVLSFVTLFFILSPGHFGENDPFCPSSARCLHPFLSQATCERTLPLSHFFCLRPYSIDSSYHHYWLYLHPLLNRCTPNISPLLPSLLNDMPPRKKPVPQQMGKQIMRDKKLGV